MPPKNLAAVRISDRSTETQTQTGYPIDGNQAVRSGVEDDFVAIAMARFEAG